MNYFINRSSGDIIYSIPVIKAHAAQYKPEIIQMYCGLDFPLFKALEPLMWHNKILLKHFSDGIPAGTINLDNFRYNDLMNKQHLIKSIAQELKTPCPEFRDGWQAPVSKTTMDKPFHIINVTQRYRDRIYDWTNELAFLCKSNKEKTIFLGTKPEYDLFRAKFKHFPFSYYPTKDLLEAASLITGAPTFSGTQSSLLAIAEGLGVPYRFERSPSLDNVRMNIPRETIINKGTHKYHFFFARVREGFINFKNG